MQTSERRPARRLRLPPVWLVQQALRLRNALGRVHTKMAPGFAVVIERMNGLVDNKALFLMTELSIPDCLASAPRTAAELAQATGADADALERVLAFLVSRGMLRRSKDGRFANNAVSDVLRVDHPDSMRNWVLFVGADWHWAIWNQMRHALMTGQSGTVAAHGVPFFDYLSRVNPAAGDTFTKSMSAVSAIQGPLLAKAYDFMAVRRVCDVGGGSGTLLAEVLRGHPHLQGVVFDLPALGGAAQENLAARGVGGRCAFVGGSFFEAVPAGCDRYLLQAIVHDWDDDACVRILGEIRRAMAPGARVLVIESVLATDGSDRDQIARTFDVMMLVLSGSGRERTRAQFGALFDRAGFVVAKEVTLPSLAHVFELVPGD